MFPYNKQRRALITGGNQGIGEILKMISMHLFWQKCSENLISIPFSRPLNALRVQRSTALHFTTF